MEYLKEIQKAFIQKEIWMLTFGAAFQRSSAYVSNASDTEKVYFKNMMSGHIGFFIDGYKGGNISDDQHITNIKDISKYSENFSELFVEGRINFGIAQKMLNLFLKYQWCLGNIQEPPHFPVDRIIQQSLNQWARRKGITQLELKPWTRFTDEKHYLEVINLARTIAKLDSSSKMLTPAQLELELFERR